MLWAVSAGIILSIQAQSVGSAPAYSRWSHGPSNDQAYFPIAVWLQDPSNAEKYRRAGFNTYVGLWKGPTEEQLSALKRADMRVICSMNDVARKYLDDGTIVGWMHGDEPDNAQALGPGRGWGPPVPPDKIVESYRKIRTTDPSRPVLLNLGQGVAWDEWHGRGVRSRHPEDYPKYIEGCDVVSFDIYPAVHDNPAVAGKLWYVARGVERLVQWTGGRKVVWNCLECTRIGNPERKPTPAEVRAEAWMSLVYGSRGLIYFVHQFKPAFREAALLDYPEMLEAVTKLNHQIIELAPVLNSPVITNIVAVRSGDADLPVAVTARRVAFDTYIFAVGMRGVPTSCKFIVRDLKGSHSVNVLGENRSLEGSDGEFEDQFDSWAVHLYRIAPRKVANSP